MSSLYARLSQLEFNRRPNAQQNNPVSKENTKSLDELKPSAGVLLKTIKGGDLVNYPKKGDQCTIHYEAFNEKEMCKENPAPFDSSRSRNQMFQFILGGGQVIEGLDVAVSKMSTGQIVEATIPYPYHYGIAGYPPMVPPRSTLIFRVELIRFESR
jgi:FK506-binding protein 1